MSRLPPSRLRPLLWIACALALPGRSAAAEKPAGHQTWVLDFHYGAGNLSMEGDSLRRDFGLGTQLRLGHVLNRNFTVGFQTRSWSKSKVDSLRGSSRGGLELSRGLSIVTMTSTLFPTGQGFYVRGGAGVCTVRQEFLTHSVAVPRGRSLQVTHLDAGFAAALAAGWEYRAWRRLGVTIDLEYARFVVAHVGGNLVTYDAGLNVYW